MTAPVLQVAGVCRRLAAGGSAFTIVIDRLELAPGTRLAIVGPSGSGKSTMLALLGLALRPDPGGGTLCVDGTDALPLWRSGRTDALAALRAGSLGFVPQTGALLPFLSLWENILLPQRIVNRPDPAFALRLAERLGIADLLQRRPAAVSVGQRQRAAIARALAHRPTLLLADEPTAAVHPAQADAVLALLSAAAAQNGTALVITTHDPDRAAAAGYVMARCEPHPSENVTCFRWPEAA